MMDRHLAIRKVSTVFSLRCRPDILIVNRTYSQSQQILSITFCLKVWCEMNENEQLSRPSPRLAEKQGHSFRKTLKPFQVYKSGAA